MVMLKSYYMWELEVVKKVIQGFFLRFGIDIQGDLEATEVFEQLTFL